MGFTVVEQALSRSAVSEHSATRHGCGVAKGFIRVLYLFEGSTKCSIFLQGMFFCKGCMRGFDMSLRALIRALY